MSGTTGDDDITGTDSPFETIDMSQGGNDTVHALGGMDTIKFGATFDESDFVDGGDDIDVLELDGDYSAGLTLLDTNIVNIEQIGLRGAFTYDLTVAPGNFVDGLYLSARYVEGSLHFDGSAAGGPLGFEASQGSDVIICGSGDDFISVANVASGGNDTFYGGEGNDQVDFGQGFASGDRLFGGSGYDILNVYDATFAFPTVLSAKIIKGFEEMSFQEGTDYNVLAKNSLVPANAQGLIFFYDSATLNFDGSREKDGTYILGAYRTGQTHIVTGHNDDSISVILTGDASFDGGAGTDGVDFFNMGSTAINLDLEVSTAQSVGGHLVTLANIENLYASFTGASILAGDGRANTFIGSTANDQLYGRGGADTLRGSTGADLLYGGAGADTFWYTQSSNSRGATGHDTIGDFNGAKDGFRTTTAVTGFDGTIAGGTLSNASFDSDLGAALSGHLGAHHAVLFAPDAGDYAGKVLLIIDNNGSAAYDFSGDLVIQLDDAHHLDVLSLASFHSP